MPSLHEMVNGGAVAHAEITLLVDRGVKKVRVNLFKDGMVRGFLRPVEKMGFFVEHGRDRVVSR